MDDVHAILSLLNDYAPKQTKLSIRTTDLSKRARIMPDEQKYTMFCEQCKERTGKGTPDAMRKNLFPDFHRMGLISRYDTNGIGIEPYDTKTKKKYVALTGLGLRFVQADSPLSRHYIFSKSINELLEGRIGDLLKIFHTPEYSIKYITQFEYMFFISAIDSEEFDLSMQQAVDMVRSYRELSKEVRKFVTDTLREDLVPQENTPKPCQRDFGNWRNKVQQIYSLLKQTIYFDADSYRLVPIDDIDSGHRLERSRSETNEYFKQHRIEKQSGFELHHVVPLAHSECKNHFKMLDTWKNMVYIDGRTHQIITQKKNRNVIMRAAGNDLELLDYQENKITLVYGVNIKYAIQNQSTMIAYNREMRKVR